MYVSLLEIDVRTQVGRTWLGNPYRVHQRLLMAFPGAEPGRVLFRIENEWPTPRIITQAEAEADWDTAFGDLRILAGRPQQKAMEMQVSAGEMLRFRLRANPTKRLSAGKPGEKIDGPRVGLFKEVDQRAWLARKAEVAGFEPVAFDIRPLGTVLSRKNPAKDRAHQSHLAVEFEGLLQVVDSRALAESVRLGIGSGKAYGNGMLSLARA
jgi:CRISPR system Cascade subunit CasE